LNEYETLMERLWHWKAEIFWNKPICLSQILHELLWDRN